MDEPDRALRFIEANPNTPAIHPITGDQSWPLGDGRYRLFFRLKKDMPLIIFMADIIDNKKANLPLYPEHKIPTYTED